MSFFFSSRRRHTSCALVTGVQTCALPIYHVTVAEGLGCKAIRVKSPNEFKEAFDRARELMAEFQVPVVVEFILERVTNVAMGTELNAVNEFEEILCLDPTLGPNGLPKGREAALEIGRAHV